MFSSYIIDNRTEKKNGWGRDTYDSFGNGRIQILRSPSGRFPLWDSDQNLSGIIDDVFSYSVKGNNIYAFGTDQDGIGNYFITNFVTGKYAKFVKIEDAPTVYSEELRKLSNTKELPESILKRRFKHL